MCVYVCAQEQPSAVHGADEEQLDRRGACEESAEGLPQPEAVYEAKLLLLGGPESWAHEGVPRHVMGLVRRPVVRAETMQS